MNKKIQVSSRGFYNEYYGHPISDLKKIYPFLRESSTSLIWTAGDSSLDNKYWFTDTSTAVGVYKDFLEPPRSKCDVTYWLNFILELRKTEDKPRIAAINAAVEATTLNSRSFKLKRQDIFLRDNISRDDTLIVSVGGNDVALLPSPCTIFSALALLSLPTKCVEHGCTAVSIPLDDYCWGCGPSFCSCAGSCPPCLGYFAHLFGMRVQRYIEKLTSKTKPKKILVCMVYYLDETHTQSWAGVSLKAMGYDQDPSRLQTLIKKVFEVATCRIKIPESEVIAVPLFNALDGKNTSDYVARVEPSASGGKKLAEYLLDVIDNPSITSFRTSVRPPSSALMTDRH